MKQKDIALVVLIAFISAVVSFFISDSVFVTPANRQQKVEVVDSISPSFSTPDQKYFNSGSIDPAPAPQTGPLNNQNPFNGTGQ